MIYIIDHLCFLIQLFILSSIIDINNSVHEINVMESFIMADKHYYHSSGQSIELAEEG